MYIISKYSRNIMGPLLPYKYLYTIFVFLLADLL